MKSNSPTLKKATQIALLTKRLPSEMLGLDEEALMLFELDYQLLMRELSGGEESAETKKQRLLKLLEKKRICPKE